MAAGLGRDFFISHATANRSWAEWIAVELERAGYTTVVQSFDFRPGADFVHAMHDASEQCERTVAVLSPAYLTSRFGEAEWRVAFAKDPTGERGLLVPVRVQPCQPPGLLRSRIYVDLVDVDEQAARQRLLAAVDRSRPRPTSAAFPGARSSDARAPYPGRGPEVSNLPARNRNFTGREELLGRLHADLQAQAVAAVLPTSALHGLGGVGKTQLVLEYAHRFAADYDVIWWIPADQPTSTLAALVELAARLDIPEPPDQTAMIAGLLERLHGRDRWLLVYDNAEQPASLTGLLPRGGGGHVLITSRWPTWASHGTPQHLSVLSRQESIALLRRRTGIDDEAALGELAELLGDLPLALAEAAAYLDQTKEATTVYLDLVRQRLRDVFGLAAADDAAGSGSDRHRVATVWSLSLQRIHRDQPAAEALLNLLAFLGPDVPRALPTQRPELLPHALGSVVGDRLAYNELLLALSRYSLVALSSDAIGVHRLVQAVIRGRLGPTGERSWATTAIGLLRAVFPDESWEVATWPVCERLMPHLLAVTFQAQRLGVGGADAGWLLGRGSAYLRGRGQYRQALPLARLAVAVTEATLGPHDVEVAGRRVELGRVLRALGDLAGARTEYEHALRIGEAALGPDHPDVGALRSDVGGTLLAFGDLAGARTEYERALRIGEAALGPHHPTVGIQCNNLGRVLHDLGDLAGARTNYERALRIGEATMGPDHPTIGVRRSNLGGVLHALGDLAGARTQLEQALRIGEAALGPEHPTIGTLRSNLAAVLYALGDLAGARTQLEQALRIGETALGPDHPTIGGMRNNLATVLHALGDLAGARTQLEQALRIGQAALGPDHPDIGTLHDNLGVVLHALGDPAGARTHYEQALRISEAALGADHASVRGLRHALDEIAAPPDRDQGG